MIDSHRIAARFHFLLVSLPHSFLHPTTWSPRASNKNHRQMQPRTCTAGADVDRRSPTTSVSSNEPEVGCVLDSPSSETRKRQSKSPCRTQHPPPVRLNCFWASSTQVMPSLMIKRDVKTIRSILGEVQCLIGISCFRSYITGQEVVYRVRCYMLNATVFCLNDARCRA